MTKFVSNRTLTILLMVSVIVSLIGTWSLISNTAPTGFLVTESEEGTVLGEIIPQIDISFTDAIVTETLDADTSNTLTDTLTLQNAASPTSNTPVDVQIWAEPFIEGCTGCTTTPSIYFFSRIKSGTCSTCSSPVSSFAGGAISFDDNSPVTMFSSLNPSDTADFEFQVDLTAVSNVAAGQYSTVVTAIGTAETTTHEASHSAGSPENVLGGSASVIDISLSGGLTGKAVSMAGTTTDSFSYVANDFTSSCGTLNKCIDIGFNWNTEAANGYSAPDNTDPTLSVVASFSGISVVN